MDLRAPFSKTRIAPGPGEIQLTIKGDPEDPIHVEDIEASAADAMVPGGSSIAAMVLPGAAALVRCKLFAGAGAPGMDGSTPSEDLGPTDANDPTLCGQYGLSACLADKNLGAYELKHNPICPSSVGGMNGRGLESHSESGGNGEPLAESSGLGGKGAQGSQGQCSKGGEGAKDADGKHGQGGGSKGPGFISVLEGITAENGQDGKPGAVGQGGGGGGGAKGKYNACYGADGGDGGAGGCGGEGGKGGSSGGSSVALIIAGGALTLDDVMLVAGSGGKGGDGAKAQDGAIGGSGGKGGAGHEGLGLAPGCDGGAGGRGGKGGHGGGGRGGHSLGIAFTSDASFTELDSIAVSVGPSGKGGAGKGPSGVGRSREIAQSLLFESL